PDIICLSKALTAGLVPMGLTTCSGAAYAAFYSDDIDRGLFHGHTYSANPLPCTAARAALELLQGQEIHAERTKTESQHRAFQREMDGHPKVATTRTLGVIFALELKTEMERYGAQRSKLYDHFMAQGVYLRPLGNTIYILSPYIIDLEQLDKTDYTMSSALELA